MTTTHDYGNAVARALLAIVFIYFGVTQFMEINSYAGRPAILKFVDLTGHWFTPTLIVYAVAIVDLLGGILLLAGFQTRPVSLVLFIFVLLTLYLAHDFWNVEGAARANQLAHFLNNLSIMGGLLLLFTYGGGRCSVDGRDRINISRPTPPQSF